MARTTVSSDSSFAKQLSRGTGTGGLSILRGRRLLQPRHDFSPRLTGLIGRATSVLVLILMTLVAQPDLVRGVKASSAMLPEQRPQLASVEVRPLPVAPQARIFHPHPRNAAASVEAMPTPTLPLLFFFYLVIMMA